LFVCRLGREYDFLKVLDFGMVSRPRQDPMAQLTEAGMLVGTPAFLAPELVSSPGNFAGRADIYALGCVAYWLLTGRPPFQAPDALSLLQHHSSTPPLAPSTMSEQAIPADLDAIVLECLSKDPAMRPATGDVLWERLDRLRVGPWDQTRARAWWEMHAPDVTMS
jgi:serine/threonine-protein kinase